MATTAAPVKKSVSKAKAQPKPTTSWLSWISWILVVLLVIVLVIVLFFRPAPVVQNNDGVNQDSLPAQSASANQPSESTTLVLGPLGSYHAVHDSNVGKWTLGIWPEAQINEGDMNLADLKIKGGAIEFVMPFDGVVNNSAGTVKVNNQSWTLGNPIQDEGGNTLVKKGDLVTISYGPNNDSAGLQIWFK